MSGPAPAPRLLDVRGLAPPEPMERVLDALDTLAAGERLCMVIDREPRPLYRILEQNGYAFSAACGIDGVYEILIWQRS